MKQRVTNLIALTALIAACGQTGVETPVPTSGPTTASDVRAGGSVLDALRSVLPSEGELQQRLSRHFARSSGTVAAAPSTPQLTLLELVPYIYADGVTVPLTEDTDLSDIPDGALVAAPYKFTYADATTSAAGTMELRFNWDADQNLFFAANPQQTIVVDTGSTEIYVTGTVYNQFLDDLDGTSYDNGELPGAHIGVADTQTGDVYTAYADGNGVFTLGPMPASTVFAGGVLADGFYKHDVTFVTPASGTVEGVDVRLQVVPSAITDTANVYGYARNLDGNPVGVVVELQYADTGEPVDGVAARFSNESSGEYVLTNVPASEREYQLFLQWGSKSNTSTVFAVDPVEAPDALRKDGVFENHTPVVECKGPDGSYAGTVTYFAGLDETLKLQAAGSDADGDYLQYKWSQPHAGDLVVLESDSRRARFVTPSDTTGTYWIPVATHDGAEDSESCTIEVQVVGVE